MGTSSDSTAPRCTIILEATQRRRQTSEKISTLWSILRAREVAAVVVVVVHGGGGGGGGAGGGVVWGVGRFLTIGGHVSPKLRQNILGHGVLAPEDVSVL